MTLEELAKEIKAVSQRRMILCHPNMVSDVEDAIYQYGGADEIFKVVASVYVPEGKFLVVLREEF